MLPTALALEVILITIVYFALAFQLAQGTEVFVTLALGLQNAAFRRTGDISVHTKYLTGMITGLLADEAERLAGTSSFVNRNRSENWHSLWSLGHVSPGGGDWSRNSSQLQGTRHLANSGCSVRPHSSKLHSSVANGLPEVWFRRNRAKF
jgi:hypothetical protein